MQHSLYTATTEVLFQLAALLDSGVAAHAVLQIVQQDEPHLGVRRWLRKLDTALGDGLSLNAALQKHPGTLEPFIVSQLSEISTAELSVLLKQVVTYREQQQVVGLAEHLFSQLFYPAVLLVLLVGLIGLIFTFVIPSYAELFAGFGTELPSITQTLLTMSHYIWILPLLIVGLALAIIWITRQNNAQTGRLVVQIPLLGRLQQRILLVRLLRTAAFLLNQAAKPSLPAAFKQATTASSNAWYRTLGQTLDEQAGASLSLADQLARHPQAFPAKLCQVVRTGSHMPPQQLVTLLTRLADSDTRQVQRALEPTFKLLNLIIAIIYGIVIGLILLGLYVPVFNMGSMVSVL